MCFLINDLRRKNKSAMTNKVEITYIEKDFSVQELDNKNWQKAKDVEIGKYWSGETAPIGRHFKTKLLWSDSTLYVRFCAEQAETLVVSEKPDLESKTIGLWDRDVCEIFVAPDKNQPNKYFEFEVAPTGEWIDLAIKKLPDGKRETDFHYYSGMQTAAKIEKEKILSAMKIPWKAFGKTPNAGDVWLGNLFRCVGAGESRGYLAWQPTKTPEPAFHVHEAFGEFEFVK